MLKNYQEVSTKDLGGIQTSRDRILTSAVNALTQGGEAAVRVNEISRESGVAVTSLYHFFGNREGLIAAAQIARYRQITNQEFASVQLEVANCNSRGEFRELMTHWLVRFMESQDNIAARKVRLQTYASAVIRPDIAKLLAEDQIVQGQRMFEFLEPLKAKGWIKPEVDTRTFGAFYLGVMTGRMYYEIGEPPIDVSAWTQFALNAILQIIPEDD